MISTVKNLIEFSGVADNLPENPKSFRQFNIQETLILPAAKPDIEQIVKVSAEIKITETFVLKTPGPGVISLEGQVLTGWKLIIEGELIQKILYVADESTQSVHAAHFSIPFSTFVVLPQNFEIGTPIIVKGYIEDIYAEQLDKRRIFKNVTILLDVEL